VLDGCSNEQSIADTLLLCLSLCQPNSQVRREQLKSEFLVNCINTQITHMYIMCWTVEFVDECVRNLKRCKAAGHDELTAEHVQNAHPLLP